MNEYDGQPGPSAFELHDWMPPVWNPEGATKQLHVDTTVSLSNRVSFFCNFIDKRGKGKKHWQMGTSAVIEGYCNY